MSKAILQFLSELQENNNRPWFQENKKRYDALRNEYIRTVEELIKRISLFDPEVAGLEAKDCLFRIYRDLRFSPNKLPYKNHFGAYMALGGKNSIRSGYYFHLEPGGNSLIAGGLWQPESKLLKMVRKDVYENIEELVAILEDPGFKADFPNGFEGEKLKRMPDGYGSDFPHSELLLNKDFCVYSKRPDSFFEEKDWLDQTVETFKKMAPLHRFLNYTVDEFEERG